MINMNIYKKILFIALPVMVALIGGAGCNEKDTVAPPTTVDTLLSTTPNLTIFKAAVEKTGLTSFTKGPGPFTYFAPSDAAFKASGINSAADLNSIDINLLTQVIAYHMMAGSRTQIEIPAGPNAPQASVMGLSFYASKNPNGTFINGSKLVQQDVKGSNGIIHVINRVNPPPFTTILATLQANPNFKLLVQGITKAALTGTFTGSTAISLFAPTNAAFTAAGFDSTAIANLSGTALTNFSNMLKYHVVTGRLFSSELKDGTLKTTYIPTAPAPAPLLTFSSGGTKVKGVANTTPANITFTDFLASNGVIQTVDAVLKYQ